jgi:hypothetical protein
MECGVSRPAVARCQLDNNVLYPGGTFIDRQTMIEYQNGETRDRDTSPILLSGHRIGNTTHLMSGEDLFAPNHLVPSVLVHSILFMNDLLPPFLHHPPA